MRKDGHILLVICLFLFENAICSVSVPFERGPGPWSEPGDPGLLKFQYYCKFRAPQVGLVAAKSATLLVRFNQDVQDIVNWNMIITSPAIANRPAKVFVLTNEPIQDFTNFTWSFHAIWKGVIDYGPPVRSSPTEPTGKCELVTELVTDGSSTQAPASTTQASQSSSVSTSVYIGVGIGVFVFVLIAVAVIVIVNKRRRRMLHIEPLNSRYSPRGEKFDAIVDTDNVPRSSPKLCHQTHRGIINKHSYLELDGNGGYVDIADVASSIYPPKRALPGPPDATRTAENGYLTLVTASLPRDISEPFKTEDNKLHSAYVTSSATPMTTEISMHKLSTL